MSANSKTFTKLKRDSYDRVRQQLSAKRWSLPSGDSGYLRGHDSMIADWTYDEKGQSLSIRIRETGRDTYDSLFSAIATVVANASA
jgi:hypothetical protein